MNLLVTGGAGFIGSNLIRLLLGRPEISKLVNLDCLTYAGHPANLTGFDCHSNYFFERVDLRDKSAVLKVVEIHGVTHVMHLAAESHVDRSISWARGISSIPTLLARSIYWSAFAARLGRDSPDGRRFHHVSDYWMRFTAVWARPGSFYRDHAAVRAQLPVFRQQGRQ